MKNVRKIFWGAMVSLALIIGVSNKNIAEAATTNGMKIYAINLPANSSTQEGESGDGGAGDAVLVESAGKYLLMDTGGEPQASSLVSYLKGIGVTNLDVYISHTHSDHRGGLEAVCANFKVGKIYLPDKSIGGEYVESDTGATQEVIYNKLQGIIEDEKATAVYLKKGDTFSFGKVSAKVLGPVGTYHIKDFAAQSGDSGSQSGHYLNNCSLTTMLTCGSYKFLTTGDIEIEEETALVKKYGSGLNADILKLSHHGLGTSNSSKFLGCVTPTYSFGLNAGYTDTVTVDRKVVKKTYTAQERVHKYGFCYMVGDEKKPLIMDVTSSGVKMYKGSYSTANLLSGWVSVKGIAQVSSGAYSGTDKYYIASNGKPLTGVQKISGKYYYLGNGGCMEKGYYEKGSYVGYRSYGNKIRYYDSEGAMTVGFKSIGGNKFYFDQSGYKVLGSKDWKPKKIGNNYYALNENGAVFTKGWKKYSSKKYRYFDTSGKMKTGWFTKSGKKYYLDKSTGYRTLGFKKIGKKTYYFVEKNAAGYIWTNGFKKIGKKTYHFNSKGYMSTGFKTIKGKTYYFDEKKGDRKTGVVQIGIKLYYFNDYGVMAKSKKVVISGKKYKVNSSGIISKAPSVLNSKVSGIKVTSGKGKCTVKWKKNSKGSGYVIYTSTSQNGTYKEAKTISGKSEKSATIKSLKSGKTYYVKVVAYKEFGGIKIYSKMSSPIAVTIK